MEACLHRMVGATVTLPGDPFVDLFSESTARVLVTVAEADVDRLHDLATRHGVPVTELGVTGGDDLVVTDQFAVNLLELRAVWSATLPAAMA